MTTETDQLEYNDAIVSFVSIINQHGARKVLRDLQMYYPGFFEEVKVQIARFPEKPVAALLRK
jgi:hypothetical protein